MYKKLFLVLFCLCSGRLLFGQNYTPNWPEEAPEIVSALPSRTSINVASIEKSLLFYRDILGLRVFYERKDLDDSRLVPFCGMKPGQTMNLTVLTTRLANTEDLLLNTGYIGLSEIHEADGTPIAQPEIPEIEPIRGAIAILIMVKDVMSIYKKVVDAGYEVLSAPKEKENGNGFTQLLMRGPDGERLWISPSHNIAPFIKK